MFRHIQDFLTVFEHEYTSTLNVMRHISNEALMASPHDHIRSIRRLAWHITLTLGEMPEKAGIPVDCPDEHAAPPDNIEAICQAYERAARSLMHEVKGRWTDADLSTEVNMYGESWTKSMVLMVLIKHEVHHRGQLTVLMRLQGLKVPGVYGPSKEEWAAWNMPIPE